MSIAVIELIASFTGFAGNTVRIICRVNDISRVPVSLTESECVVNRRIRSVSAFSRNGSASLRSSLRFSSCFRFGGIIVCRNTLGLCISRLPGIIFALLSRFFCCRRISCLRFLALRLLFFFLLIFRFFSGSAGYFFLTGFLVILRCCGIFLLLLIFRLLFDLLVLRFFVFLLLCYFSAGLAIDRVCHYVGAHGENHCHCNET